MASIKDVAKAAGVSISTVSNVINGNKYVSDELAQQVRKAIKALHYETDLMARSLKNNKTMTIGVILTSMDRVFFPQVLNGMQRKAEQNGYNILIYISEENAEKEKKYLRTLINSRVDGIALDSVAAPDDAEYFRETARLSKGKKRIPVTSLERDLSSYGIDSVFVDNRQGAYHAVKHLAEAGCRNIVHIAGPAGVEMVQHRTAGYRAALQECGLSCQSQLELEGSFSPFSGYRAVQRLLRDGIVPDGVFADNDQMAIGAIKALRENNFEIPRQVKVIGFDNTFVSSIVRPALSSINVPKFRMGQEVMELLFRRIDSLEDGKDLETASLELATNLLVRESTGGRETENWDMEGW